MNVENMTPAERERELERLERHLDHLDFDYIAERRIETRALNLRLERLGCKTLSLPPLPRRSERPARRPASGGGAAGGAQATRVVRAFGTELGTKGRTLTARIVPYGVPARVSDGGGPAYMEVWRPGAFAEQMREGERPGVLLNFEHMPGLAGVVGSSTELHDEPDGLHGSFRLLRGSDADKCLELVKEGVLTGVSLEAIALESATRGGVVERLRARLDAAALCRRPAYRDAKVLAVRDRRQTAWLS